MAAAPVTIVDPTDLRIAEFRDIRERDLTGRQGRFIAEGTVVLRMLAQAHRRGTFAAEKILLLANRAAGVADILAEFPEDVPVYIADAETLDGVVGFHLHRGVLALGRKRAPETSLLDRLPEQALVIAGCGLSNHDNAGSMFRNAAAFKADAIFLDETSCDPLYRKALRVSVGSVLSVPYERSGTALALLSSLAERGFDIWTLSPRGTVDIRDIPASPRMALVAGTEGEGLPAEILARFRSARIPQSEGLDSLNVATATGIALFSMASAARRI